MLDYGRWACLLEEGATLTLPITPYRTFPQSEIVGCHRVVRGITAIMSDACSATAMVEGIGRDCPLWGEVMKRCVECLSQPRRFIIY